MTTDNLIQRTKLRENRIKLLSFFMAVGICVLFYGFFLFSHLSSLQKHHEVTLDEKINPNYAPEASLVRLPGIGIGRAKAIVDYRQNFKKENGREAFQSCNDLQKVKGIGPKTVQNISEWLKFD